jgi:hypothetical protein
VANQKLTQLPTGSAIAAADLFYSAQGGTSVKQQASAIAAFVAPVAASNLTYYVATTGSDTNPGTSGSPFATIQHAVNVAAQYNYQNLYAPTINLATGTYNKQVILPALTNCPAGGIVVGNTGTPSNVKVADLGTAYAFTWAPFSIWTVEGIQLTGTYGGFSGDDSVAVGMTLGWIDFAGAMVNAGINLPAGYTQASCSGPLTTSASSMGWLLFSRASIIFDTFSITFTNAITFSHSLISADSKYAFLGFYNSTFTNGSHVTCTSACLVLANGAFFETGPTTNVDGTALTRANFPGHSSGFSIDQWSVFQPDGFTSGNAVLGAYALGTADANCIFLSDGGGTVRGDYNKTITGNWTFTLPDGNNFVLYSVNTTAGPGFSFVNGSDYTSIFFITGSSTTGYALGAGHFALQEYISSKVVLDVSNIGNIGVLEGAQLFWATSTTQAGSAPDTGLTRESAGLLKVTNGSSGYGAIDASGYSASGTPGISVTIATAKLTSLGGNGSMTFTNGLLTAQTAAT